MKSFAVIVLVVVTPVLALKNFERCKHNGGGVLPYSLEIESCPKAPCDIYEGDILRAVAKMVARKLMMINFFLASERL